MKEDVLAIFNGQRTDKGPSKETLNHPGLIAMASGLDPYKDTKEAYLRAYEHLGIDIVNRVPDRNAPVPLKEGESRDLGNGYVQTSLGMYDTVSRNKFPFSSVDDFLTAKQEEIDPSYEALITPVPHKCTAEDITLREKTLGDRGVYYYMLYTTLFMWGVEYLGWETYMMASALDELFLKEQFLDKVLPLSLELTKIQCRSTCPFVFHHDDLADARGPVFDPSFYDKYIFPSYQTLWAPVKDAGKKLIYVADGNMEPFLDQLKEAGVDGVMLENPATDFDSILDAFNDGIIIGGVDTQVLTFQTPDVIKKHVRELHEKVKGIPGFVISTPGGLHGNIPLENLEAYFDIRAELGYTPENWKWVSRN